ncbi:hypothetical protein ACROYT_G011028 [Oculina patagonica]
MDVKTLLNNLHEEVSCSVCMNTFTDPKQLPCLHSFCLHCLQGILRTSGRHDIILCPECRRECKVPGSGNLNELPTNFRINSLLDVLAIKECDTTAVRCGNCDKKSSQSFYCFQCSSFWCESDCISLHNGIKANKGHHVLALKDFQDEDFEKVLKRPVFCGNRGHENKELEFFCKGCAVAICHSCVATVHDGHAKILLEEAANERKTQAKSVIEYHKQKAQEKINEIARLDLSCAEIQAQVANVKRSAQQFAENMIATIEAQKQEIFNEVENRARESIQQLGTQKSGIEHQLKMTEAEIEQTEAVLKRNVSAEIMQPNKFLDKTFQPEEAVGQDDQAYLPCVNESIPEFKFIKNEKLFNNVMAEKIGFVKQFPTKTRPSQSRAEGKGIIDVTVGLEARFVLTTGNAEGEQCYDERDRVAVEIKNQQGHDCATKARVEDSKDGTYNISYFAKEKGKCSVSVKVNEEHVPGSPFAVKVKARQFRPVLSFGEEGSAVGMLSEPFGVAVNNNNDIAVADSNNNRVQVFSSEGIFLRTFGTKGDKQGEFDYPLGIAFDNDSGNIIVADKANGRVQLFSGQGEYLNQFGSEGSLDQQLTGPVGLTLHSNGNFLVVDPGNKQIKAFSHTGQFLDKIGKKESFTFPVHCIEHDEYLIVSDAEEHCIKFFDGEGNFLYKFGNKGDGNGEFNGPGFLSVNKAGHLMVCDSGNNRVQVFELSGKFITKFGTEGSELGEFSCPISSAVLGDGRIVVSDSGNNCIKIFE